VLTLYHFATCPYCLRVRRAIDDLNVEVELRDIHQDPSAAQALHDATGRTTVPVLYIADDDAWMPESTDIVRFLYARFGDGRRPPLSARLNPQWVYLALVLLVVALLALR